MSPGVRRRDCKKGWRHVDADATRLRPIACSVLRRAIWALEQRRPNSIPSRLLSLESVGVACDSLRTASLQQIPPCDRSDRLRRSSPQRPEGCTVAQDERLLFPTAPSLQLTLACDRACCGGMLLGVDHSDGPPGRRVRGALSIVVSLLSRSKVLSVADIQRVVSTAQDVRKRHPTTMPSS